MEEREIKIYKLGIIAPENFRWFDELNQTACLWEKIDTQLSDFLGELVYFVRNDGSTEKKIVNVELVLPEYLKGLDEEIRKKNKENSYFYKKTMLNNAEQIVQEADFLFMFFESRKNTILAPSKIEDLPEEQKFNRLVQEARKLNKKRMLFYINYSPLSRLCDAIIKGDLEEIKRLHQSGVPINGLTEYENIGYGPIGQYDDDENYQLFFKNLNDDELSPVLDFEYNALDLMPDCENPFITAVLCNRPEIAKYYINNGVSVNQPSIFESNNNALLNLFNYPFENPVREMKESDYMEMVKYLIKEGINLEQRDERNISALEHAQRAEWNQIAELIKKS